jgi:hypothetical protein
VSDGPVVALLSLSCYQCPVPNLQRDAVLTACMALAMCAVCLQLSHVRFTDLEVGLSIRLLGCLLSTGQHKGGEQRPCGWQCALLVQYPSNGIFAVLCTWLLTQLPPDKAILAAQVAMAQEQERAVVVPPTTYTADMAKAGVGLTAAEPAGPVAEPGPRDAGPSTLQAGASVGEQPSALTDGGRGSAGASPAKRHKHEGVPAATGADKAAKPDGGTLSSHLPYLESAARLGIIDQLGPPDCELAGTGGTSSLSSSAHEAAGPAREQAGEGGANALSGMSTSSSLGDLIKPSSTGGVRGPPWHLPAHRAILGGEVGPACADITSACQGMGG